MEDRRPRVIDAEFTVVSELQPVRAPWWKRITLAPGWGLVAIVAGALAFAARH